MIPKIYVKDQNYPHFPSFGISPVMSGMVRADFPSDPQGLTSAGVEIVANANIESILQVHRRKMLRRAANRRSAQLSRARKKVYILYFLPILHLLSFMKIYQ
jgi:hypothetical protein